MRTIIISQLPDQSEYVGQPVTVTLKRNPSVAVDGIIVRDDLEQPCMTVIQLTSGEIVDADDCFWSEDDDWR